MSVGIPHGYVYRVTNKVNGKVYIGKHRLSNEPWRSYLGSGVILSRALRKHGRESFTKTFLAYAWSSNELSRLEEFYISQLNDHHYNIQGSNLNARFSAELDQKQIVQLYITGEYSTNDLAEMFHCSQSMIAKLIMEQRPHFPELAAVTQGRGLKPVERSAISVEKMLATRRAKVKVNCSECNGMFLEDNMERHRIKCMDWPRCAVCDKRLSRRDATHCRNHFPQSSRPCNSDLADG